MAVVLSAADVESFRAEGFVVLRQAYCAERIESLLSAVRQFLPDPLPHTVRTTRQPALRCAALRCAATLLKSVGLAASQGQKVPAPPWRPCKIPSGFCELAGRGRGATLGSPHHWWRGPALALQLYIYIYIIFIIQVRHSLFNLLTVRCPFLKPGHQLPYDLQQLLLSLFSNLGAPASPMISDSSGAPVLQLGAAQAAGDDGYTQLWHRDFHPDQSKHVQDEGAWLQIRQAIHGKVIQMNAPLLPGDDVLQVLPGSHSRVPTADELAAVEASWRDPEHVLMPGAIDVRLEPGDVVYYDNTILHRGHNPAGRPRLTIHNAYWAAEVPTGSHDFGQEQTIEAILQEHGHKQTIPYRTKKYMLNYIEAARRQEKWHSERGKHPQTLQSRWWVDDGRGGATPSQWVNELILGEPYHSKL
eukprot:SAG31_NODE_3140_length_4629_cov_2.504636_5_plen_415_part_00